MLAGAHDSANGKVYNLDSNEVINLRYLAEMLIELGYGGSFELIPFPPERDIGDYYSDFSLIEKELGWSPRVKLHEGLLRTIAYCERNHHYYWDAEI